MDLLKLNWDKSNKHFCIRWMWKYWRDAQGPHWWFHTNGAFKNKKATCLDISIHLGYLVIEYTDFAFRKK